MKTYVNPILNVVELEKTDVLTASSRLEAVAAADEVLDHNTIFGITG